MMGANPLKVLEEKSRQDSADDSNFYKHMMFFFELRVSEAVAARTSGTGQFLFPLVVGPSSYSVSEPFTVEKTPTQGGGLYVEENGIVMRTIRLRGTTGFKPRPLLPNRSELSTGLALGAVSPSQRSFGRVLPTVVLHAISGQRHFQYLQDAVFRIYADLKRDPETSRGTQLYFHNPQDREAWLVVPERFDLNRDASGLGRTTYEYDIEMTAVAPTQQVNRSFSEDKELLDTLKDGVRNVQSFIDQAAGFTNDITNTVGEVRQFVADVDNVLDSVGTLANAGRDFVEGVTDLIEAPAALVVSTAAGIGGITDTLESLADTQNIPSAYINAWRLAEQAVNRLGMAPQLFESEAQRRLREIRARQLTRDSTIAAASEAESPADIAAFGTQGSAPLPGAVDRAAADYRVGVAVNRYTSARSHRIGQGDTLVSLAAALLGDARLWQDIALLNGLKAPFVDSMASVELGAPGSPLPGVLSVGQEILIPTFGRGPQAQALLPVLGATNRATFTEQMLGVDYQLQLDAKGLFDWVVDTDHGATDIKLARGVDNLSQAMVVRLNVARGHNPLYKRLGLDRIIGLGNLDVDAETSRLRVSDAIEADPRISHVKRIDTLESNADALVVDADVEVRGFSQGLTTQAIGVL